MAKNLLRLFTSRRNISIAQKYCVHKRFCHSETQVQVISSDLIKKNIKQQIFDELNADITPKNIDLNLKQHKNDIDSSHVVTALILMHKYYQQNAIDVRVIQNDEHFLSVCQLIKKFIPLLTLSQTVQILKILNQLKISSSSMIMQSLLQIIRHSINDLELHNIYLLSFILKKMKPTHLSDAILRALPKVFEANYELKLDRRDINELKNALWYASDYINNKKVNSYIIEAIGNINNLSSVELAAPIFISLANIHNLPTQHVNILSIIQETIIRNADDLDQYQAFLVIIKTLNKINSGDDTFYNIDLINKTIKKLVSDNIDFTKGIDILNSLNKAKLINLPLLDYLSAKCCENPLFLTDCNPLCINTLALGLAHANFKPSCWNTLNTILLEHSRRLPNIAALTHFTVCLASLECFDPKLLSTVFRKKLIVNFMTINSRKTLQQLYQIVKTLYPTYDGPWPSEEIVSLITALKTYDESKVNLLSPALEKILGDSNYFKNNITTHLGHHISHLIVFQNNSPIVIESTVAPTDSNTACSIDDLIIPDNSNRVALLLVPPDGYSRNIPRLTATFESYIKSLEALSYTVAFILEDLWISMPECEKLPYLRELLGLPENRDVEN